MPVDDQNEESDVIKRTKDCFKKNEYTCVYSGYYASCPNRFCRLTID